MIFSEHLNTDQTVLDGKNLENYCMIEYKFDLTTNYPQTANISCTLVGNKIVDHSDVVGALPAVLLQLHLHSQLNTWLQWIGQRQLQDESRNI